MDDKDRRIEELENRITKMEDLFDALRLPFSIDEIDIDSIWVNYTEELENRNGSKGFRVDFEYEEVEKDED